MARQKKADDRTKEPAKDAAILQVSVEDFVRTRDSVVTGLSTLQAAVQDLSRAYILHTNTVLGRAPGTTLDLLTSASFTAPLADSVPVPLQRAASPGTKSDVEEGSKKKKKRFHDPNAPKRPLTPYFLYMQSARKVITQDLGAGAKPKDVSEEGTRRWAVMPEDEKHLWTVAYQKNLAEYRIRAAAYKLSIGEPDEAAAQLAAENGVLPEDGGATDGQGSAAAEEPTEVAEAPQAKSPKPAKRARKSAGEKRASEPASSKETPVAAPAKETVVAPPPSATKSASKEKKTPDKKKTKAQPKAKADVPTSQATRKSDSQAAAKAAAPKEKRASRKRKSDAIDDA